jgi:hypothetical protein
VTPCVICPARPPRNSLTDSLACDPCVADLTHALKDLEQLLPVLRALLAPGRSIGDGRGGGGTAPAPLRVDVLSLLEDARSPDAFVARWGAPADIRGRLNTLIESEAELREFARDLRALHAAVIRVCGEPGPAKVATCRRLRRGKECRGAIVATPGGDNAQCSTCGDQWPRARWRLLGRLDTQATAEEAEAAIQAPDTAGVG